jgi:hypothetical protein
LGRLRQLSGEVSQRLVGQRIGNGLADGGISVYFVRIIVTAYLKRLEGLDTYDYETNFNPLAFD